RQVALHGDGKLQVIMHDYVQSLRGVTIAGEKSSNVRSTAMGVQKIDIQTIKLVPSPMGEADILRVLQMLPGVTSAGEGSTGLNVRGGNVDQTLVLLDGATVYNPAHFFGFFSAFNPDVIKDAALYKSSIPVRYGSRLASVLDVITREGNQHKFSGSGGIGPLNGHVTLEGPIGGKTTFIAGARASYSDWILHLLKDPQYQRSSAGFYDGNLKITSSWNDHNTLYLSGYISNDRFKLDGDTLYRYGNQNGILRWKHVFNSRLYGNFSVGTDHYKFNMRSQANTTNAFNYDFRIAQEHANVDMVYTPNNKHRVETGVGAIYYALQPGNYEPLGKGLAAPNVVPREQALESAVYVSDEYTITPDLSLSAGLRGAMFNNRGPGIVNEYLPGVSREISSVKDSITYGSGKNIKTYMGLEPRMALRYTLNANSSVKAAYNRTQQFIHMLSNTTVMSPTDTWKLSDTYIRPEIGDQVSIGYYRNFKHNTIETSAELYYKWIRHALSYKSGANLLLNHHIETDVANADGKAYGVELLLKKTAGKMTGWVSYTYSRTLLRMRDPLVTDPTNHGNYYPADYDKPHMANLVANYRVSHRFNLSLTTVYSTGRPITLPIARYYIDGSARVLYADRNTSRIPDYFRTDFSMNIEGNHKVHKLAHSSWSIGVYNMLARRNAYSVYFVSENGNIQGYKL
ncbi:MAG TPA: TonB-dependent receptor, partial [Chitinophaga sp.]